MERPSLFLGFADLLGVFLYGTGLCYAHFFIYPMSIEKLWIASGVLGFFLGSFAPPLEEIIEWIISFGVGVCFALTIPQLLHWFQTGAIEPRAVLDTAITGIPFTMKLLGAWLATLPLGYLFSKFFNRNYYRHARFF